MSLVPRWFNRMQKHGPKGTDFFNLSKFFEEFENSLSPFDPKHSGVSISSDEKNVFVEAQVPGLSAKDIDVSLDDNGMLWIKGEKKQEEEDKERKYYKKSQSSFSYCLPVWDEVDLDVEPKATCKDGVMKICFSKKAEKQSQSKRIHIDDE
jgi:HSP20 family protein